MKRKEVSGPFAAAVVFLWFASYVIARLGLEVAEATWAKVALALLPIPFFVLLLVIMFRAINSGDELFRRIHLEALAFAFPAVLTLLMVLGLFELGTGLKAEDWSYRHVWPMAVLAYYGGWALAMRKYK
jgi:hypothetical protein